MAKNLASVKPVKCYGVLDSERVLIGSWPRKGKEDEIPCTLMTSAHYRMLMAIVLASVDEREAGRLAVANPKDKTAWENLGRATSHLRAAIKAAEKAGAV